MDARVKTATGPTILLQSGHYFDLLDPASSRFTLGDIAHGLGNACRFAGQCQRFYSVAKHSWHASFLVPERFQLAALMHDAAEAFIGDVTRPLKKLLPGYREIEQWIELEIDRRFALAGLCHHAEVKRADIAMLAAEQAAMMPEHADDWAILVGVAVPAIRFRYLSPWGAREVWLERYTQLTSACRPHHLEEAL